VTPDATTDEIRAAYRRLVRAAHPDAQGPPASIGSAAGRVRESQQTASLAAYAEAWKVLRDPTTRSSYDLQLRSPARTAAASDWVSSLDDDDAWVGRPEDEWRPSGSGRRARWRTVLVAVVIVSVLGALALSAVVGGSSTVPQERFENVDGILNDGDCVNILSPAKDGVPTIQAREVDCEFAHNAEVRLKGGMGFDCPVPLQSFVEPGGTVTVCLEVVDASLQDNSPAARERLGESAG
jgi:hypothetical protein